MYRFNHAVVAMCMFVLLTFSRAALAGRQKPVRTVLPTDSSISVYVGAQATWQSLVNPNLAPQAKEMVTDTSAYTLDQTPTRANFADHALTLMPLPDDSDWYVFAPTTDTYNLKFDIVDTANRLGRIVVTDLDTGEAIGSIDASADHSSIVGQLSIPWTEPYYRIDGYTPSNTPLFRLAASNGAPDTYVHFKVSAQFQPYKPALVTTPRWSGSGVQTWGPLGDPYNPQGVLIGFTAGSSQGAGAADGPNDSPNANPLYPPQPYVQYQKKKCIEALSSAAVIAYPSNTTADVPLLAADVEAEQGVQPPLTDLALGNYTMAPYSINTAAWTVKFDGRVVAFFVVPFRVRQKANLWTAVLGLSTTLQPYLTGNHSGQWVSSVAGAFATWLLSDSGKSSGLKAGMVIPLPNDVKTVTAAQTGVVSAYTAAVCQDVTFTLQPDQAPVGWTGWGLITLGAATTTPSPPPASIRALRDLTFAAGAPSVTRSLPKGYRYTVTGCVNPEPGFTRAPAREFQLPGDASVAIPCTLNALFTWKIYTETDGATNGPATVTVKNSTGGTVGTPGPSVLQPDGRYLYTVPGVSFFALGNYTVSATRTVLGPPPPKTYTCSDSIAVAAGVTKESTITLHNP